MSPLEATALEQIFRSARTHKAWLNEPVSHDLFRAVYDLCKWGPTSANSTPGRFVFVKSKEAKEKLIPCLDKANVEKVRSAPATIIIAEDVRFYEQFTKLAPHAPEPTRKMFEGKTELAEDTAFRNSSLQGAYFIIAARALGLDCGPMSGFDNDGVDAAFFAGTSWRSNFLCNIGYGDASKLFPRAPRLDFEEACRIL